MTSPIWRAMGPAAFILIAAAPLWAQQAPSPGESGDALVARVNGAEIHQSDVVAAQQRLPAQYRGLPLAMVFPHLVEQLVDIKLAAQAAERDRLQDGDAVRRQLAALREQVLAHAYWSAKVGAEVDDDMLKASYDAFVASFPDDYEIRARHILVDTEDEARAVIAELKKGADFAELAQARSKGPSAPKGGDLGYFGREQMVKPFADAAFGLDDGEITQNPVKTQFGWHVIKVVSRRKALPPSFEEMRADLETDATEEVIRGVRESLRTDAAIERFGVEPAR